MKTWGSGLLAVLTAVLLGGCSLGQALGAETSTPSAVPSGAISPVPLPNYNARYGNNRVAAEAAIKVGRALYAQQQYWEVYVKTDPPQVSDTYDAGKPESFDSAARQVRQLDLILATESGPSIRAYTTGGVSHETDVLTGLAKTLQALFPAATQSNIRVFYGEGNLHATAVFANGQLDYKPGPAR